MHLLTEEPILRLLLQMALLLGCARALGEVFRRMGQPSVTAEILVGIFFGPAGVSGEVTGGAPGPETAGGTT